MHTVTCRHNSSPIKQASCSSRTGLQSQMLVATITIWTFWMSEHVSAHLRHTIITKLPVCPSCRAITTVVTRTVSSALFAFAGAERPCRGCGCWRLYGHGGRAGPPPARHAVAAAAWTRRHAGRSAVHPPTRSASRIHVALYFMHQRLDAETPCLEHGKIRSTNHRNWSGAFRACTALANCTCHRHSLACAVDAGVRAHGGALTQLQNIKAPYTPFPVGSRLCHSGSGLLGCHVVTDIPMALSGAAASAPCGVRVTHTAAESHRRSAARWVRSVISDDYAAHMFALVKPRRYLMDMLLLWCSHKLTTCSETGNL